MLNEKKVVPKLRQEVKVKVDIVTSDNMKIYYTGKFQDFTARYIIKRVYFYQLVDNMRKYLPKKEKRSVKITSALPFPIKANISPYLP